jgi:ferredoxin-NADP reductase
MAEQRTAMLEAARKFGPNTRLLRFRTEQPFDFCGGQYIIVDTGIEIAAGKIARRAYSMLSGDHDRHHFELAVRRIGAGPGSNFMHGLAVGSELLFTGPWGKFGPGNNPEFSGRTIPPLIVATDTGITAALGLLNSQAFQPFTAETDVYWLLEGDDYFVPSSFVRERIYGRCRSLTVRPAPPAGSAQREDWLESFLKEITSSHSMIDRTGSVFVSGDGMLVFAMRNRFSMLGVADIRIETFFNHQEKKAVTPANASRDA